MQVFHVFFVDCIWPVWIFDFTKVYYLVTAVNQKVNLSSAMFIVSECVPGVFACNYAVYAKSFFYLFRMQQAYTLKSKAAPGMKNWSHLYFWPITGVSIFSILDEFEIEKSKVVNKLINWVLRFWSDGLISTDESAIF